MSAGVNDKPLSGTKPHRGFSGLRSPNAPSVLGAEHPVSRSAVLIHTLVVQATATSSTVLVGVLAVAERRSWGVRVAGGRRPGRVRAAGDPHARTPDPAGAHSSADRRRRAARSARGGRTTGRASRGPAVPRLQLARRVSSAPSKTRRAGIGYRSLPDHREGSRCSPSSHQTPRR